MAEQTDTEILALGLCVCIQYDRDTGPKTAGLCLLLTQISALMPGWQLHTDVHENKAAQAHSCVHI